MSLKVWKKCQQGNLRIRELVSRAEKIESGLEQEIKRLSTVFHGLTPIANTDFYQNSRGDRIHHVQIYKIAT